MNPKCANGQNQIFPMRIKFGISDPELSEYEHIPWNIGEVRSIEFFPDLFIPVSLITVTQDDLTEHLKWIDDGNVISLDLEWDDELCLFQFCTSKGVLVIRHPKGPGHDTLRAFLKSHKFYGKGIVNDKKMLFLKFGDTFEENIEDIAKTRLRPYGYSENFNEMTCQFAGIPTAQFKDIRITTSNWGQETLTIRQVMYAAFDVVALFVAYPNFPPPKQIEKVKHDKKKTEKKKYHKELKWTPLPLVPTHSYILKNYEGSLLPPDLRNLFPSEDLDYIHAWNGFVFVSLYKQMDTSRFTCEIQELPPVDVNLSSDTDDFYITEIPECLRTKAQFHAFMYSFGTDHSVRMFKYYARVCCCTCLESHRLRTFLPHLVIDGHRMQLYNFPWFSRAVTVKNLPPKLKHHEVVQMFSQCGTLRSLTMHKKPELMAKMVYTANEAVSMAVSKFDCQIIGGNEIRVIRGCDMKQLKHMREYELFVTDCKSRKELKERFSVYGELYDAYFDPQLGISHVLFISKADAMKAQSETAMFAKQGSRLFLKGVSASTTREQVIEIASQYGRVISLRCVYPSRTTMKSEVTYLTVEEASAAQAHLSGAVIDGCSWTACLEEDNGSFPAWKNEWKNQWISMRHEGKSLTQMIELCSQYGCVVDATMNDRNVYIFFSTTTSAKAAFHALRESHKASYLSMLQFVQNTNSKDITLELVPTTTVSSRSDDDLAIVVDPLPETFDEEKLKDACGTLGVPVICPSKISADDRRAVVFPKKPKYLPSLRQVVSRVFPDLPTLQHVDDVTVPKAGGRRSRMVVFIDPLSEDFDENNFRSTTSEIGSFEIKRSESSTCPGKEMLTVTSKKNKTVKLLIKFLRRNEKEYSFSVTCAL